MKRLTLLCLASEREATVEAVRGLGVVHVTASKPPEGERLEAAKASLARAERALGLLRMAAKQEPSSLGLDATLTADEAIVRVNELDALRKERRERADTCARELSEYAVFGEFDPDAVRKLEAAGVYVRLGKTAAKSPLSPPPDLLLKEIGRDQQEAAFCLIGAEPFELDELDLGAPVVAVPLPACSPSETRRLLQHSESEVDAATTELCDIVPCEVDVAQRVRELADAAQFATVREGMGEESVVAYLQGYIPAENETALRESARHHGWGVVLEDPAPGEPVPTLLRYHRWVKPVLSLFDFLRIYPGYRENDVGLVFLLFFSLFFGMLVGDAVYGLLLVALAVVIHRRLPKVSGHVVAMIAIVGGATAVWGILTGNYLGIAPLSNMLRAARVGWLSDRDNLIELTFFIGAVHMTIAHIWNIVEVRPRSKAIAQSGWIVVLWSFFLLARTMVLGQPLPRFVPYALVVGVVAVALFMATRSELKHGWINHALLPLTVIGNFVDVLSYVRLYAVGYASVAVVQAFNGMAASIGLDRPLTAVPAVLLLLFAHALNLVLCALAVLVHAVRLNTLEFSNHKGLAWQGFAFEPFRERAVQS